MSRRLMLKSAGVICGLVALQLVVHLALRIDVKLVRFVRDAYVATRNPVEHKPFLAIIIDLAYPSLLAGASFVRYCRPRLEIESLFFSFAIAIAMTTLQFSYAKLIGLDTPWVGVTPVSYLIDVLICIVLCSFAVFGSQKALQEQNP